MAIFRPKIQKFSNGRDESMYKRNRQPAFLPVLSDLDRTKSQAVLPGTQRTVWPKYIGAFSVNMTIMMAEFYFANKPC